MLFNDPPLRSLSVGRFFLHYLKAYLGKGFLAQVSSGFTCTTARRWLLKRIVSGVNKLKPYSQPLYSFTMYKNPDAVCKVGILVAY